MESDGENTTPHAAQHANALQEIDANPTPVMNGRAHIPKAPENTSGTENLKNRESDGDEIKYSENIVPEDENDDSDHEYSQPAPADVEIDLLEKKKKRKKKSKSKSKRGLLTLLKDKPTGFEEFYVDAPVTPETYQEELSLYHESLPFTERIQTAIQRFFAKRNFHSERKDVFDKYMTYGGIAAGSKMFTGGLDEATKSDRTAAEIRELTATHFVTPGQGEEDDPKFVVDFEGCVKGFLSCRAPQVLDMGLEEKIKLCTSTIHNFLNYLLYHNVCPEYKDDVNAARAACLQADKELCQIARAHAMLPGKFNEACSMIYGGTCQEMYIGDQDWARELGSFTGMNPKLARQTFKIGFTANATDEMFEKYKSQSQSGTISIASAVETGLEVTELILANRDVLKLYDHPDAKSLRALGKMKARTWIHPGEPDDDRTEEEKQQQQEEERAGAGAGAGPGTGGAPREVAEEYEFWIEDELLQRCFVGMKLETTIRRLSFGLDFFDYLAGAYCSFYTILPNELMVGWREPGPRLPPRPKVGNVAAEEAGEEEVDEE